MKRFLIATLFASLLLASCSRKPVVSSQVQESLLGAWWSTSSVGRQTITMEFAKDGTYKTTVMGQTTLGTYRWLDETTLELNKTRKVKVSVGANELTMTIGNEVSKFQRGTPAPAAAAPASSAAPSAGGSIIARAVLANRISPLLHNPLDVSEQFPSEQATIWVVVAVSNAPPNTNVKAVLIAADTAGAAPANTKLGENDASVEGSRNVGFSFSYPNAPPGKYKADIYLNGQFDRTLNFTVAKGTAPPQQPLAHGPIGSCAAHAAGTEAAPGFGIGVTMAPAIDSAGNPENPGRTFPTSASQIYAVLETQGAPADTKLQARWIASDTGGIEPCNSEITRHEVSVSGSGRPRFSITPPPSEKWPEGLYRVEIYVNGNLALSTDFSVCEGGCKF
jgi:hypothetical protein